MIAASYSNISLLQHLSVVRAMCQCFDKYKDFMYTHTHSYKYRVCIKKVIRPNSEKYLKILLQLLIQNKALGHGHQHTSINRLSILGRCPKNPFPKHPNSILKLIWPLQWSHGSVFWVLFSLEGTGKSSLRLYQDCEGGGRLEKCYNGIPG